MNRYDLILKRDVPDRNIPEPIVPSLGITLEPLPYWFKLSSFQCLAVFFRKDGTLLEVSKRDGLSTVIIAKKSLSAALAANYGGNPLNYDVDFYDDDNYDLTPIMEYPESYLIWIPELATFHIRL